MNRKKMRKEVFNNLVDSYESSKVSGAIFENSAPQHPFQVTHGFLDPAKFSGGKIEFEPKGSSKNKVFLRINTGFCNADEVKVFTLQKYLSDSAKARLLEDRKQKNKRPEDKVEIELSYKPTLVIGDSEWRPIGQSSFEYEPLEGDKGNIEKVPDAFLALGVSPAVGQTSTYVDEGRRLFTLSVVLHCERWYTEAEIKIANPFVEATTAHVEMMPKLPPNSTLGKGKIMIITEKFKASSPVRTLADVLFGVTPEAWDRLLVCEVYAVSPPEEAEEELYTKYPSPSYRIFKKQYLSWNTRYLIPELPKTRQAKPFTLQTGLLGGLADAIFNTLLTIVNDTTQLILNILTQLEKRKGKFLTI